MKASELENHEVMSISAVERHYGEFKVQVKTEEGWFYLEGLFGEQAAERLLRKYGEKDDKLTYTFIHDQRLWEEDEGSFEDFPYYGDGLDCIDELHYMD